MIAGIIHRQDTAGTVALAVVKRTLKIVTDGLHAAENRYVAEVRHHVESIAESIAQPLSQTAQSRHIFTESIQSLKDRLRKQGLENAEIEARVVKLLAEAEKEKAVAVKTRAESDKLEFAVIVSKLRLLLEAQRAMEQDRMEGFLDVLREMDT